VPPKPPPPQEPAQEPESGANGPSPDSSSSQEIAQETSQEARRANRSSEQRSLPWFWLGAAVGTVVSVAGLGLAAWAWIFIHKDLAPLISKTLTESLDRPVDLGDVEKITLDSLEVGPSALGASDIDPTTVNADQVIVKFDLIKTLLTSELDLDLTVVEADGYLAQDAEKGWLNFKLPEPKEPRSRFQVNLEDIHIRDSQLTLAPLAIPAQTGQPPAKPPLPIPLEQVNGQVNIDQIELAPSSEPDGTVQEARRIRFDLSGSPVKGGKITVKGEAEPLAGETADEPIKYATNLQIQGDKAPLADILSFTLSTIKLPNDDVTVQSGEVSGTLELAIRPEQPVDYSGTLSLDKAGIQTTLLPLPLKNIAGQTRIKGNRWTIDRLKASYGEIEALAKGLIDFDNGYDLTATADDVSVQEFTNAVDLKLPVPTEGSFDATAQVKGRINRPEFSGSVTAVTPLQVDRLTFTSASSDFSLTGRELLLANIAAVPNTGGALQGAGQVSLGQGSPFTFELAGSSLPAREIAQIYELETPFTLGLVAATATVTGRGGRVNTTVRWDAPAAQYPGSGVIDIDGRALTFRDTTLAIGGGTARGSGSLLNGEWTADVALSNVQLNQLSDNLRGDVNGRFDLRGNTADNRLAAITGQGDVAFSAGLAAFNPRFSSFNSPLSAQVAWNGQRLTIDQAQSDRLTASGTLTPSLTRWGFTGVERFDLDIAAQDYALDELPFTLPTAIALAGNTDFDGRLTGSSEAPNFSGNVRLADLIVNRLPFDPLLSGTVAYSPSQGLALNVAGDRDRIALNFSPSAQGATSPNLNFDIGWRDAFARGQTQGELLNVQAGNFPLTALNFPPAGAGQIGQLRGTLTTADLAVNLASQTLEGDIVIDQLGLGYIGAGRLAGQVRYADSLATLTGGELRLEDNLYTLNGSLTLGGPAPVYSANIETQEGDVQNILTALSIYRLEDLRRGLTPPDWLANPVSGSALDEVLATSDTGNSAAPLLDQLRRLAEIQAIQAEIAQADADAPLPPLAELTGPFAGNIQLNGSGTDFQVDFDLAGANWRWGQDYSAEEVIAKGTLTPNVLTLEPVRFASIVAPPPEATASTDALGDPAESADSTDSDDESKLAAVTLAGQLVFGRDTELTSNLQAAAENLNVANLRDILQLPLDIEGLANATATLGGTLANPQLRGSAALADATINNTPIQAADAQFLYQNARLSLNSALTASTPEQPLTLSAQIPYAFNFMDIQPESDAIAVDINVQDEGLALLNIFNQQVAWQSGSGQVNLNIGGTLASPEIAGFATLDEAVLSAKVLPEPLTNVNGRATFVGDRIVIETLQGRFSDGQLIAAGTFPLLDPLINGAQLSALADEPLAEDINPLFPQPLAADRPLTVNFENIDLNFRDLYTGGVNGQIIVGGSALIAGPQIGGGAVLSNGQVLLPSGNGTEAALVDDTDDTAISDLESDAIASSDPGQNSSTITPTFRDLRLTLGNSVRIVQGNLLNFVADGSLLLNGPPSNLEPDGTISLKSGRVSLFTTLFRLTGQDNTADFTPETGLQNPFLNIDLRASVPEIERSFSPIANTPFASADIADTSGNGFENSGSLRTIRVRAEVNGPANAIFENLELSSSPSRSQDELVGLIGGTFIAALEPNDDSLSGNSNNFQTLLNLVSGPLLTSVQDFIGSTLNLSEFRLFPVTSASRFQSEENSGNGLDVGAEIGFDITNSATVSVGKILTDSSRPEFGANYRLTDALTIRGTTNFDDINQVLLEYELRF
jgi:translocation and assembly module TamB